MSNVLIVGGGFAGVWSAAGAARVFSIAGADRSVALVAPNDDMVIRPRLYEANPDAMRVPLDRVLDPIGVRRVQATVTSIDTDGRRVVGEDRDGGTIELDYDRLVLAAGSRLNRPEIRGAEHVHDIDTIDAAISLERHILALPEEPSVPGQFTAVVVGAGFTGLEIATELVGRLRDIAAPRGAADEVKVVVVEREQVVGPDLGPGPRPVITQALGQLGVETRLGLSVTNANSRGVSLSDGTEILARTVVWTAGMQASPLTAQIPASRDRLGRLIADDYLRVATVPGVFVAGDTAAAPAEPGHQVMQSCQHASPLGRYAGHNVAADLLGLPLARFAPSPYVTCLALGGAGAVFTHGWDRAVESTGEAAKKIKRTINEQLIYPPIDDAEKILNRAAYTTPRDLDESPELATNKTRN